MRLELFRSCQISINLVSKPFEADFGEDVMEDYPALAQGMLACPKVHVKRENRDHSR